MKFRLCIIAIVAAVAITAPAVAFAESFSLQNQSDAWVLLSINFPTSPKGPSPATCIPPNSAATGALPASRTQSVYLIALSGANCYVPRLWEHGVTIGSKGAVVTVGQSGATVAANSTDAVRVDNRSAAWVLLSITSAPYVVPAVTSFCIAPAGHVTTPNDFPKDSKAYVIVLAGANCSAPRLHEQNASGDRIVVHGARGAYTVTGP